MNYIINSSQDKAIKKSVIAALEITTLIDKDIGGETTEYILKITLTTPNVFALIFETDSTLEGIQAKAATVLAALEE